MGPGKTGKKLPNTPRRTKNNAIIIKNTSIINFYRIKLRINQTYIIFLKNRLEFEIFRLTMVDCDASIVIYLQKFICVE